MLNEILASFTVTSQPDTYRRSWDAPAMAIHGASNRVDNGLATIVRLQVADASQSAQCFKLSYCYETTAVMRPFSHGGAGTMLAGFLVQDALRVIILKHASPTIRRIADTYGVVEEARCINMTRQTIDKGVNPSWTSTKH